MNSLLICLSALSMNLHNAEIICEYSASIVREAQINNIKPSLIVAVGTVESRWTPAAKSIRMRVELCKYFQNIQKNLETRVET